MAGVQVPPDWFVGDVFEDAADKMNIAGTYANGFATLNRGVIRTLNGLRGSKLLGLANGWLCLCTIEWIVRVNAVTGVSENLWRHRDPLATFHVQPCADPTTLTLWTSGSFTGLVVHAYGSETWVYPVAIHSATVCVGWRSTCPGEKSGYVCTADQKVLSFALMLNSHPECLCLHLDHSVGELNWGSRFKLDACPTCVAVTANQNVETIVFGTKFELLCVEITGTIVAVSSTPIPGGVSAIRPANNAYWLMTGMGPKSFSINMTTNVANLTD
jgi:hypothetical protein